MRLKALVLSLAACMLMTMAAHAAPVTVPTPLVYVDASNLPLGDLLIWYNQGTLGGQFNEVGAPPQVEMVAGRKAVTFNGMNGFRSSFSTPSTICATNPWSVSIWANNPNPGRQAEQWIVTWTKNGTTAQVAAVGFGSSLNYGAVHHYGGDNDLGWDRGLPSQGVWHNITVTFSGISAIEKLYVDGVLTSVESKASTMDIQDQGFPFLLGLTDNNNNGYAGSVSSIKVWASVLSEDQVLQMSAWNDTATPPKEKALIPPQCPKVINGGFELPRAWGQNTAPAQNRSIPGWGCSETMDVANAVRNGIGVCGPNVNLYSGGSPWDNGVNTEGNYIMEIAGTGSAGQGISQYFYFYAGKTYRLHFNYNCKTTGTPTMIVNVNGSPVGGTDTPLQVYPVDPQGVFQSQFYEFEATFSVPTNGFYPIEIREDDPSSASVLLIDDFQIGMNGNPYPVQVLEMDTAGCIDFGVVGKPGQKNPVTNVTNPTNIETSLTIRNLSNATLNFGNNYGASTNNIRAQFSGIDSGAFEWGYYNVDTGAWTRQDNQTTNWFSVSGYDTKKCSVLRFKPGSAMKTYTATLLLTFSNGNVAGIMPIPIKATLPAYPEVENGSFEQPHAADWNGYPNSASLTPYDYYDYLNDNCIIPNWYFQAADGFWYNSKQIGIGVEDRQNSGRFLNQNNIVDGRQALYMQTIGYFNGTNADGTSGTPFDQYSPRTRTIRQYLGGFQAGHSYVISLWAGVRNSGSTRAALDVKFNGSILKPQIATTYNTGWMTVNNNSSVTLTRHESTWTPIYYQYTHSSTNSCEGPYPLDISAYTLSFNGSNSKWQSDATLVLDKVQIYDASLITRPAANFTTFAYLNTPETNTYMSGRTFDRNRSDNQWTFYAGVGQTTHNPNGFTIHVFNEGYYNIAGNSGGLNITNVKFLGSNGRHFWNSYTTLNNVKGWGNRIYGNMTASTAADLTIRFNPKAPGYLTDTVVISTNDTTGTYYIPVAGYAYATPQIKNGSFEEPPVYWGADSTEGTVTNPGKYAWLWRNTGASITPTYWAFTAAGGNAGVSTWMNDDLINNGTTFRVNNGKIVYGNQAVWMQAQTSGGSVGNRALRQRVWGFQAGQKYHFRAWVNSAIYGDNAANFILRITDPLASTNGIQNFVADVITATDNAAVQGEATSLETTPVMNVDDINVFDHPYTMLEGDFIPPKTQDYNVELYTPFNFDDSTLLIDNVQVDAVINGVKKWSMFD